MTVLWKGTRRITFSYLDGKGAITDRDLVIYSIEEKRPGIAYLIGYADHEAWVTSFNTSAVPHPAKAISALMRKLA